MQDSSRAAGGNDVFSLWRYYTGKITRARAFSLRAPLPSPELPASRRVPCRTAHFRSPFRCSGVLGESAGA